MQGIGVRAGQSPFVVGAVTRPAPACDKRALIPTFRKWALTPILAVAPIHRAISLQEDPNAKQL